MSRTRFRPQHTGNPGAIVLMAVPMTIHQQVKAPPAVGGCSRRYQQRPVWDPAWQSRLLSRPTSTCILGPLEGVSGEGVGQRERQS